MENRKGPLDEAEQAVSLLSVQPATSQALILLAQSVGSMRENQRRLGAERESMDRALIDRLDQTLGEVRLLRRDLEKKGMGSARTRPRARRRKSKR